LVPPIDREERGSVLSLAGLFDAKLAPWLQELLDLPTPMKARHPNERLVLDLLASFLHLSHLNLPRFVPLLL
jgi:hypothetical protein